MIDVGIQENIELSKIETNDKGTLVLSLKKTGGEMTLEEKMNSVDTGATGDQTQDYFVWPFKLDKYVETGEDILQQANNMKKSLTHILKGYLKEEDIVWNLLNGMEIKDVGVDLIKQSNIDQLYGNIISQFSEMIEPFLDKEILFRVKFVRQSQDKHFSSLPRVTQYSNLKTEPFWETMDVLAVASQVAYSNYEKGFRKGDKDKPSQIDLSNPKPTIQATEVDPQEAADVEEVMGMKKD